MHCSSSAANPKGDDHHQMAGAQCMYGGTIRISEVYGEVIEPSLRCPGKVPTKNKERDRALCVPYSI